MSVVNLSFADHPESMVVTPVPRVHHRTLSRRLVTGAYLPIRTIGDWFIALGMLIVFSPLLVVLAAVVKLTSPGPAIFSQRRVGKDGRVYKMYKLRSMVHDCEKQSGIVWSTPNDPRVTKIGRWLRDTHLDELPQLFNILTGSMSLIGPRPERPEIIEKLEKRYPDYHQRLAVKPGVTGLAQMQLPADTEVAGVRMKLAHDLYYIDHLSPLLDLQVAFSTLMYFTSEVAYILSKMVVKKHGKAVNRMLEAEQLIEQDRSMKQLHETAHVQVRVERDVTVAVPGIQRAASKNGQAIHETPLPGRDRDAVGQNPDGIASPARSTNSPAS